VSKVDFADKSLNQTARIKIQKTQKVNKAQKIKIDYAYFIESNSDAQRTSFYTNKTIQARKITKTLTTSCH
jgi:hypothetical protein